MHDANTVTPIRLYLVVALFVMASLMVGTAGWLYRSESTEVIAEKTLELSAIGRLKVEQLSLWRRERIGDVTYVSSNPVLGRLIADWLSDQRRADLELQIRESVQGMRSALAYESVILASPSGRVLLEAGPSLDVLSGAELTVVERSSAGRRPLLGEFFARDDRKVYISAAGPVVSGDGRLIAVILLRMNADETIFPIIEGWTGESATAETALVRRDGSDVLFLNKVRFPAGPAMTLRVPLDRTEVVSVKAISTGARGVIEGRDYLGREVAADVSQVPGTPWLLVTKIGKDELLAEALYRQSATIVVVMLVSLLGVAAVIGYQSLRRQVLYRSLWEAERAQVEAQGEIRATLYSIGDAVITTDSQCRIRRMNPVAAELSGWSEREASGKPLREVFRIVHEDTRAEIDSPVDQALRVGSVVALANHTMLLSRDGPERPIADSAAPIRDAAGEIIGAVLVFRDQTHEREVSKALAEDAQRLRILFESATAGIVLVLDGKVLEANHGFAEMLGCTQEEALQMHVWDWDSNLDTAEKYFEAYPVIPATPGTMEIEMRRRDGTLIDLEVGYAPIYWKGGRAVLNVCNDVTERKRADAALRRSERLFRDFAEFIPQMLWLVESDGKPIYGNKQWEAYTGQSRVDTIDGGWRKMLHPDDARASLDAWSRAVAAGGDFATECRLLRRDGVYRWFSVRGLPLRDSSGQVVRWLGTCTDIHDLKDAAALMEISLQERTRDLVTARDQAVAATRVKDVFLATMSHELRTPLNSIIGFSDLMMNGITGELSPAQLRQVAIINKSGHHLLGLIADVLDISKVEAGQMPLQIESLNLREMFEEQRQAFDIPTRQRGLELRIELPDPTVRVRADAKRARQVISNLMSNAVKYTDHGYVSLKAGLEGDMVRIVVQDTGIGIPAEELPGMFQPFHRIPAPKGVIRDGTGLGLAISRRLVTAMNGEIGIESEPAEGSRFWFTLPAA